MSKYKIKTLIILLLSLTKFSYLIADTDIKSDAAGVLLNQNMEQFKRQRIEEELEESKTKKMEGIEANKAKKIEEEESDILFLLNEVIIDESEVLSKDEIDTIIKNYKGKSVGINDIYSIVNEINTLYDEKGYIVCRAILPEQTISNGEVKILLIEGKTGEISVNGNNSTKEKYIKKRLNLTEGEISNINELNESLIWFNGSNDIQMRIEMKAGKIFGTTNYILNVYEPKKHQFSIFSDNLGSNTTGVYRAGINYINSSVIGNRDQLTLTTTLTKGSQSGGLGYSFPLGSRGTRLGLQYSASRLKIIKGDLKDVNVKGKSSNYGINISRPLSISDKRKIEGYLEWTKQNSKTDMMTFKWVDDKISRYVAGLTITSYMDSSLWYNKHEIVRGNWKSISSVGKSYTKYNLMSIYQKTFKNENRFSFKLNGQYAFNSYLPSSDQFYLGGLHSVRGYKENLMGADSGISVSAELSIPTWKTGEFFVFLDGGALYGKNAWEDNKMCGIGMGYRLNIKEDTNISLTFGVPLVKNISNVKVDSNKLYFTFSHKF